MTLPRTYWRWSAGVQLARLPATMAPLAFTLLATAVTGSYRLGGVMMALFVAAELLGAVPAGRLLDRIGPARGLLVILTCAALMFGALTSMAVMRLPGPVLLVLVAVPGSIAGGLSGGFRSLLPGTIPAERLARAVAVDAMLLEGVLIAGPLLVSLCGLASPVLPLAAMALAYLASAALVPRTQAEFRLPRKEKLPIMRAAPWLACQFAIGHLLSTIEVAPLPLVQRLGAGPGLAGLVIAVLSGSSILGSAIYAWRAPSFAPRRQACLLLTGFIAGGSVVAADLGWAGLLTGAAAIGACTGPLVTLASVQLQRLLPEGRRAEGFSLSFAVQGTGFALGSLSIGVLPLWLAPALAVVSSAVACAMLVLLTSMEGRYDRRGSRAGHLRFAEPRH
ncbi:MFS transporter [Amycolatopsis alkalitolerans]|uniref:MFS transporter n=1 Tax=Amycolatopsis alkalitolerans TaxID=2547244 RepID=UPI001F41C7AF|nr:MFS transporter [Amycolatopsis alkalitolerans]